VKSTSAAEPAVRGQRGQLTCHILRPHNYTVVNARLVFHVVKNRKCGTVKYFNDYNACFWSHIGNMTGLVLAWSVRVSSKSIWWHVSGSRYKYEIKYVSSKCIHSARRFQRSVFGDVQLNEAKTKHKSR